MSSNNQDENQPNGTPPAGTTTGLVNVGSQLDVEFTGSGDDLGVSITNLASERQDEFSGMIGENRVLVTANVDALRAFVAEAERTMASGRPTFFLAGHTGQVNDTPDSNNVDTIQEAVAAIEKAAQDAINKIQKAAQDAIDKLKKTNQ
jgi:hypothetical protein